MANKLSFITEEMENLRQQGLLITIRTIGSAVGPYMIVDGKRVLNL